MDGISLVARSAWIVWLKHVHAIKQLEAIGEVHYVSKRMLYAVVYVNEADAQRARTRLQQLPFVRDITPSYRHTYADIPGHESFRGG